MPGARIALPHLLALVAALGAAEARAQAVQITPFAGWAFGGAVSDPVLSETHSFEAALDYGGTISFPVSEGWRFELLYSRQPTRLGEGLGPSFDVRIERYLAGFQEETGKGRARWFGTASLGATRFVPEVAGLDSETRFGAAFGLGVKAFATRNLGLRLEARALYTLVSGSGGVFCSSGTCLFAFSGSSLWQGDVSGGLILAF